MPCDELVGGHMRRALLAPEGHVVVVADLSQIEARKLQWVAGADEMLAMFRRNDEQTWAFEVAKAAKQAGQPYDAVALAAGPGDFYSEAGTPLAGKKISKKDTPDDRQNMKALLLGLGFSMGWKRLAAELLKGMLGTPPVQYTEQHAAQYGVDVTSFMRYRDNGAKVEGMPSRLDLNARAIHCAVSDFFVKRFRKLNPLVVETWNGCEELLETMCELDKDHPGFEFGPGKCLRVLYHAIQLPNGMRLRYHGLEHGGDGYSYMEGRKRKHIYGGLLTENLVQALARVVIAEHMLIMRAEGIRLVSCTHDEVIAVAKAAEGKATLAKMIDVMRVAPSWCVGVPLNAEGGFNRSYGLAKV